MLIKNKLIVVFLLISIVPLAILSIFSINAARNALENAIGKDIKNLAEEKAGAMAQIITERINEAKLISEIHDLRELIQKANLSYKGKTDEKIQEVIVKIDKEWINSKGKTKKARKILNSDVSMILRRLQQNNPDKFGEIFLTDIRGANLAMTRITTDYYQADEWWWQVTFDKGMGRVLIEDRGYDESAGSIVLGIGAPVKSDGKVIGVLKIHYKIISIINIVLATHSEKAGVTGKLINSNEETIAYGKKDDYTEISDIEKKILHTNKAGWIKDTRTNGGTILGYAPVMNVDILKRARRTGSVKGVKGEGWAPTTWYMVISMEKMKAFVPIDRITNAILFYVLIVVFIALTLAVYFARSISNPVNRLIEGSAIIGGGNLDHKVGTDARDEIGQLSRAFDQMTRSLQSKVELILLLHKITTDANEASNVDEAMQACLDKVCDYTGWNIGHAYVVDSQETLTPTKLWRIDDPRRFKAFYEATKSITFTSGVGLPGRVLESGKPVWIQNVTQDQNFLIAKEAAETGLKAAFAFPVLEGKKTVAVLTFFTTEKIEPDESLLKTIENLATQLGRVTERKRDEKEIEHQKTLFESIFNGVADAIVLTDTQRKIVMINSGFTKIMGYSLQDVIGKETSLLYENLNVFNKLGEERFNLTAEEKPKPYVVNYKRKDGTPFPGETTGTIIRSTSGEIIGFLGVTRDITERKQAEEELSEYRDHLEELVKDRTSEVKLIQDIAVAANEASSVDEAMLVCLYEVCEYTGWEIGHVYLLDSEEVCIPTDLWHNKDPLKFKVFHDITMTTIFKPGIGLPGRVYKSGEPAWIKDVTKDTNFPRSKIAADIGVKAGFAFPVMEGGNVVAVLEFFATIAVEPDQSLLDTVKHLATLLGRVTERKRSEEKLKKAKEEAEDATRLKDKFVSLVSHDLRGPIGNIKTVLELVASPKEFNIGEEEKNKLSKEVMAISDGLLDMIDKLLNISRLQTGHIILEKRFHLTWAIAGTCFEKLSHTAETKGVEIHNEVDEKQKLLVDEALVGETILNLLSNAIKFTPKGGVVTIFSPSALSIAVKDNGTGVPPNILKDIFKHEVKTTTVGTDGETGTGLGLPLCNDIMDAHKGEIKVDTGESGTIFTLEFPGIKPVVVVADDQEVHLVSIKEQLEKIADVEVALADNGKDALKLARELEPVLVITDLHMPVMDGFELIRKLREDQKTFHIPIVVNSALSSSSSPLDGAIIDARSYAFELGANDFISKPLIPDDFVPRVSKYLP